MDLKSFLSNRFQKVVVDGAHSFITLVISGVPQGTVLGPILFLIYLNDINSSIENGSAIRSFADDSRLLKAIATSEDSSSLQLDLQNVISWATTNNMLLHQDKFELMQYTTSLNNHTKTLLESLPFNEYSRYYNTSDGLELVPSEQVQDLGVLLSSKLDFSSHINQIVDKACSKAAWVLSVFQCRNVDTMMTLYQVYGTSPPGVLLSLVEPKQSSRYPMPRECSKKFYFQDCWFSKPKLLGKAQPVKVDVPSTTPRTILHYLHVENSELQCSQ